MDTGDRGGIVRPRPVVGKAAVPEAVRRLLDKFDYPDRESLQQLIPILPTVGGGSTIGAFVHLTRAATQSIGTPGEAITWDQEGPLGASGFAAGAVEEVIIPWAGYYNVAVQLGWSSFTGGGTITVIRTRNSQEVTVWPPVEDPGLWSTTNGQVFEGVAPAIPCQGGDTIKVWIDADDASAQTLASATLAVYLVDRTGEPCVAIADWRLEETSGSIAVDSIGGHDGTYTGTPTLNQAGPSGDLAVDFQEADAADFVSIPDSDAWDFLVFSVEAWIKTDLTGTGAGHAADIVGHGRTGTGTYNWTIYEPKTYANGEILFGIGFSGASTRTAVITSGFRDSAWHHIVGTFDGTTVKIYMDGVVQDTTTGGDITMNTGATVLRIARNSNPIGPASGWFDGLVSRVRIWPCVLTASEILDNFNGGSR